MNRVVKPANPDGTFPVRAEAAIRYAYIKGPRGRRDPMGEGADITNIGARLTYFIARTGAQLGRGMDIKGDANAAGNILAAALVGGSLRAGTSDEDVQLAANRLAVQARFRLYGRRNA